MFVAEQLNRLIDKLRKDDVLVVWWIDRLGRDYHDSETTIRDLLNREAIGCNPSTVQRAKKRRGNVQIQPQIYFKSKITANTSK